MEFIIIGLAIVVFLVTHLLVTTEASLKFEIERTQDFYVNKMDRMKLEHKIALIESIPPTQQALLNDLGDAEQALKIANDNVAIAIKEIQHLNEVLSQYQRLYDEAREELEEMEEEAVLEDELDFDYNQEGEL